MHEFFDKYLIYILLFVSTGLSYLWLFFNRKKLNASWWESLICVLIGLTTGFAGAKLMYAIENGSFSSFNFSINSISLYGSILFFPIFPFIYSLIKKSSPSRFFDLYVIPICLTLIVLRINCIKHGCCGGIIINNYEVLPREIEIVSFSLFSIIFGTLIIKNKCIGKIYPLFLISYGELRFILEFFRKGNNIIGPFHIAHFWSITSITIGIIVLVIQYIIFKRKESNYVDGLIMGSDDEQ